MKQFFRFLTVGVTNTILGYCIIFSCMYLANMSPQLSNITGYSIGLISSYILNKNYTFKSRQNRHHEIIKFLGVFIIAYVLNFLVLTMLIQFFCLHNGASQILAGLVYIGTSFTMNKYIVFNAPISIDNQIEKNIEIELK